MGLSYECKTCHSARKKGRVRHDKYSRMTREQKDRKLAWQRNYGRTHKGRSIFLLKAYQAIDKKKGQICDLDQPFIVATFDSPCVYCGTTEQIGCDRVDNTKGHTKANVVPACGCCNVMRGDRFTHEEMKVIGRAVRRVRAARDKISG